MVRYGQTIERGNEELIIFSEVCQQSRIRHKEDFINAFSPVVAEATAATYKGAPSDIQGKLRRVIEVWRDRNIFEPAIQGAIESRLEGMNPNCRGQIRC